VSSDNDNGEQDPSAAANHTGESGIAYLTVIAVMYL